MARKTQRNPVIVFLAIGLLVGILAGYLTRPESAEIHLGPVNIQITGDQVARDGGPLTSSQIRYIAMVTLIGATGRTTESWIASVAVGVGVPVAARAVEVAVSAGVLVGVSVGVGVVDNSTQAPFTKDSPFAQLVQFVDVGPLQVTQLAWQVPM